MTRIGGKSNLVVDNNVDSSVSGVVRKVRQVEGLKHHSLATEGSVTMQQDGHDLRDDNSIR